MSSEAIASAIASELNPHRPSFGKITGNTRFVVYMQRSLWPHSDTMRIWCFAPSVSVTYLKYASPRARRVGPCAIAFGEANPAFERHPDRGACHVTHAEFAGEGRLPKHGEHEPVHVIEHGRHDAAMATRRRPFVRSTQGEVGHGLVAVAPHVDVETPRARPTRHRTLVITRHRGAVGDGVTPVALTAHLRPVTRFAGEQVGGGLRLRPLPGSGVDDSDRLRSPMVRYPSRLTQRLHAASPAAKLPCAAGLSLRCSVTAAEVHSRTPRPPCPRLAAASADATLAANRRA